MGEIREYFEKKAPKSVRSAIENAEKGPVSGCELSIQETDETQRL